MKSVYLIALTALAIAGISPHPAAIAQPSPTLENRPTSLDCLVGYPDGTYRGNRALTRYEFAAGMAACLDQRLDTIKSDFATKAEVESLLQTQQKLNQEVKRLREQVESLPD